eukprot:4948920-Amphidinium_carterae.1
MICGAASRGVEPARQKRFSQDLSISHCEHADICENQMTSILVFGAGVQNPGGLSCHSGMPLFENIQEAPIDPILGTTQLYNADTDERTKREKDERCSASVDRSPWPPR